MVMDLDALRSDYRPSVARRLPRDDDAPHSSSSTGVQNGRRSRVRPEVRTCAGPAGIGRSGRPRAKRRGPARTATTTTRSPRAKSALITFRRRGRRSLPHVAKDSGLILVMKRCPSGAFNHPDFRKYTVPEAIQILNHELDDTNFRLIRQDKFLIVLYTEDLRVRIRSAGRPRTTQQEPRAEAASDIRQVSAESRASNVAARPRANRHAPTRRTLPHWTSKTDRCSWMPATPRRAPAPRAPCGRPHQRSWTRRKNLRPRRRNRRFSHLSTARRRPSRNGCTECSKAAPNC